MYLKLNFWLKNSVKKFEFSCQKYHIILNVKIQGVPTSFRREVLVKISNLCEIRILKFSVKKILVKLKWDLQTNFHEFFRYS